jgi:hypothetical protein
MLLIALPNVVYPIQGYGRGRTLARSAFVLWHKGEAFGAAAIPSGM